MRKAIMHGVSSTVTFPYVIAHFWGGKKEQISINKHCEYFISPLGFSTWMKGKETNLSFYHFCCPNKERDNQSARLISKIFFS